MTTPNETRPNPLLTTGIIGGPVFIAVALAQALTRDGYEITKHPTSLLSNGDLGWIQIANFIGTGALFILCGIGIRRTMTGGRGRRWVGPLYIVFGAALIGAGAFVTDPALGFPPGTPEGIPDPSAWSTSATLHAFTPFTAFLAIAVAFLVMAGRFAANRERGWTMASIAVPTVALVLLFVPQTDPEATDLMGFLWAGMILAWSYASVIAWKIRREGHRQPARPE